MKVRLSLFVFLFLALNQTAVAQRVFIPEQGEGISFNVSSLSINGAPAGFDAAPMANSIEIQLLREHIFGLSHFSIASGLGYSGQYYHGNLHIEVDESGNQSLIDLSGTDYKANRFATEYLDAVAELRYRGRANKKGRYNRFYLGGLAGYRTNAYSYFNSEQLRVKFYNIKGFNPIRYGVYVKAGRGPINLYAFYGLSPLVTSGAMLTDWSNATSQNVGLSILL
jgi:hypothetical protein